MSKDNDFIKAVRKTFERYFSNYYSTNKNVQSINYYNMEKAMGYSAVLEYKGFKQYVNFYKQIPLTDNMAVINTCFEFSYSGTRYLCHFDSLLDYLDSDDISFYTYPHCSTDEMIWEKLDIIMSATEKHFDDIKRIADSDEEKEKLYNYSSNFSDKIEKAFDFDYMTYYEDFYNLNEYYITLKAKYKGGKINNPFEKRVFRVLSNMSYSERKKLERSRRKQINYSKMDRVYLYGPQVFVIVVFIIGFVALGIHLDKTINADWIGKQYGYTAIAFSLIGIVLSVVALSLNIEKPLYKLIVPKEHFEDFSQMQNAEESPKIYTILFIAFGVVVSAIIFTFFAFTGTAVTEDFKIVDRQYVFSSVSEYPMESTDIAIVKGSTDNNGYYEYIGTAYAFKLDDEWVDFGVPTGKAKKIIETAIEKYDRDVPVFDSIDDISD